MKEYRIATASSRTQKHWQNEVVTWQELKRRLTEYKRTTESAQQYKELDNRTRGEIKDVGGFVGGYLGGDTTRTKQNIECRSIVTIDIDKATQLPDKTPLAPYKYIVYSTHSYTPETPCVRIILPLNREVTPLEYRAITHKVCEWLGTDGIDYSCCEPERLMFYPSIPYDVVPLTEVNDNGTPLNADEVLAQYNNWRNPQEWAGARDAELRQYALPSTIILTHQQNTAQDGTTADSTQPHTQPTTITIQELGTTVEDPLQKSGVVGAWCRAISIYEALALCSNVYEPTKNPDRYTYRGSGSTPGVIVYEGRWVYSNHTNKDPLAGQLLNSWDLVRLVLFGHLDNGSRTRVHTNKPSYVAMCEYAQNNPKYKGMLSQMDFDEANRVYGIEVVDTTATQPQPQQQAGQAQPQRQDRQTPQKEKEPWLKELDALRDVKSGALKPNLLTLHTILQHDPRLIKGRVLYDEFTDAPALFTEVHWSNSKAGSAWGDGDMACLAVEIQKLWKMDVKAVNLNTAFEAVMKLPEFRVNPVVDFIKFAQWDGTPRVDLLFTRYLGVPPTELNTTITRKALVACVARVINPGCKFDQITILTGRQGMGKSTLLYKLAGEGGWFNDSIDLRAPNNKLEEGVVGSWIIEIPEMQGHAKKDVDSLKSFLSKRQDKFRGAYKRYTQIHKRTCVIFGTTNEEMILRDLTGNRRFWILPCSETPTEDVWSLTQEEVQQVWAEAYQLYRKGETLYLDNRLKEELAEAQKAYDANQSEIAELAEWLDTPLPDVKEWDALSKDERRRYFTNPESISPWKVKAPVQARQRVCALEVINEFYGESYAMNKVHRSRTITQMLYQLDGWKHIGRMRMGVYGIQTTFERITETPRIGDGLFELDNVKTVDEWWQL